MPPERSALKTALQAIEAQRGLLGDEATDLALAALRQQLPEAEGGPAARPEAPAPQLRRAQVTVLFADIVESTALASRLDAEDVLQVFGGLLERAATCVSARGGRVLRYTGDGLKAGFGTQGTREDDAAQAVLAGLDILAAAREHATWVARQFGIEGFAVRVGAHTGEVALGAGFEADNTLTGDTVNIAARMEQAAPPGSLRISAETWAHVRGQVDAQAQPPLSVKGVAQPLMTWLVLQARPRQARQAVRGVDEVITGMVGRDAELGMLQARFERLFTERRLGMVTVVADAGIGKTRLLREFDAWCEARAERGVLFRGRATPQTASQAYGLLRDVLAWRWQIQDDDSLPEARRKLQDGLLPLFLDEGDAALAEAQVHLLGHLVGIDWRDSPHVRGILGDPRQIRNRGLHAATQLFRRIGRHGGAAAGRRDEQPLPVLMMLDDLHWADDESLDFLAQLAAACGDVPMLMLGMTRPALFDRRADWCAGNETQQRIHLGPLDKSDSRELAHELLRRLPEVPTPLIELLTGQAEGNPFYMEELLKVLIDRGAVRTGPVWQVDAQRLVMTTLPTTLTGVLQARLDGLPAPERHALQRASIVGAVFWDHALAAVDADAMPQLPALVARRLALPRGDAALEGLREFGFHHQLLHQVTYGTVLKQDRRDGHAQVARWLAGLTELTSLRSGEFLGLAAEHFELAGDAASASEYHARAAQQASERFAHERVLSHVGRALKLLGPPEPGQAALRWKLLVARELTLHLEARRDEQLADLQEMARLAEELDDDWRRADVGRRASLRAMRMGDRPGVVQAARESLASALRAGDDAQRLSVQCQLAMGLMWQGQVDAGRTLATTGLADARALQMRNMEARLLGALSIAAEVQGDLVGNLDLARQIQQAFRDTGDRINEAISLSNEGAAWLRLGALAQAGAALDAALKLTRFNGDRVMESSVLGHLSFLARLQCNLQAARTLACQALDLAHETQARDKAVLAWLHLGEAELGLVDLASARAAFEQALSIGRAIDVPWHLDASAGLIRVALACGDVPAAVAALDGQRAALNPADFRALIDTARVPRQIDLAVYQVLAATGDPSAPAWLGSAHEALSRQAGTIGDASLQRSFMDVLPYHREIIAIRAQAAP